MHFLVFLDIRQSKDNVTQGLAVWTCITGWLLDNEPPIWIVQAVTEVLHKFRYGNSHLQMRQNPVTVAEHSGLNLKIDDSVNQKLTKIDS